MAAPVGMRTIRVVRTLPADLDRVWRAVHPQGRDAAWHPSTLSAEPVDGQPQQVRQSFSHNDRHGNPIHRRLAIDGPADQAGDERNFAVTIAEDSALDHAFWKDFHERRIVARVGEDTILTVEQTDRYRGLAFYIFRYFALRRELSALDTWLRTGIGLPAGLRFEHPAVQVGLAILSTLLLWPFFGLHRAGLMISAFLTLTIVLHEIGHLAGYRVFGHGSVRMIFVPLLGGIAIGGRPYNSRFEVAVCALMGAGLSAFLVPVIVAMDEASTTGLLPVGFSGPLTVLLLIIGAFNLLNLLPMRRFDGGQVLAQIFPSTAGLTVATFSVALVIIAIGLQVDVPTVALLSALAVFTLLSLMGGKGVKPRFRLEAMTQTQRLLSLGGLYAAIGLHGYAIVYAVESLFA